MADLTDLQAAETVKIAAVDPVTGEEVAFLSGDANGNLKVNLRTSSGAEAGVAAQPLRTDPTGTTAQPVTDNEGSLTVDTPQLPASLGQKPSALSLPVVLPSDQGVNVSAEIYSGSYPDQFSYDTGTQGPLNKDIYGNLMIRGPVITDESSIRDDFSGAALVKTMTGTAVFNSGSTLVSGTGTLFTTEIKSGDYIKRSSDPESAWTQIDRVQSDTELYLVSNYAGTSGGGAIQQSNWKPTTASGGSYSVSGSLITLSSGTTSGALARIRRASDFLPFNILFKASISQRIANQTITIGMQDDPANPQQQAVFVFDGTDNTTVKCRVSSGSAAADQSEVTVTLPETTTESQATFEIDVSANQVSFLVNKQVVAQIADHLPEPYRLLEMVASIVNTAAAVSSTNVLIDWIFFQNCDQLQITNDFIGKPQKVQLMGLDQQTGLPRDLNLDSNGNLIITALTGFGADFRSGYVSTAALTQVPVRATTYTQPTTNGQRSFASSSTSDAAAGTGARSVTLTYYDQTGAGPFTETVTLNGTTRVSTVATNICFIEKMDVATVGSGGSNVGTITLYTTPISGGSAIWTIAPGDNRAFSAHHYVPAGKTCNITGLSCSHNGTTVGSGAVFIIRSIAVGVPNVPEIQISDFVRLYGQSSTFSRTYQSPIKVTGPARVTVYVTPESTSALVYRSAIDYFEP